LQHVLKGYARAASSTYETHTTVDAGLLRRNACQRTLDSRTPLSEPKAPFRTQGSVPCHSPARHRQVWLLVTRVHRLVDRTARAYAAGRTLRPRVETPQGHDFRGETSPVAGTANGSNTLAIQRDSRRTVTGRCELPCPNRWTLRARPARRAHLQPLGNRARRAPSLMPRRVLVTLDCPDASHPTETLRVSRDDCGQ
jgi:hypothetical protein